MKYLVYIEPPEDFLIARDSLRERIRDKIIHLTSSMPHCTVMRLYANEENESEIVKALEKVVFSPFSVKVEGVTNFQEGSSTLLVAKLSRHSKFYRLHVGVIQGLGRFIEDVEMPRLEGQFSDVQRLINGRFGSPYYAQFYNPHVTIAEVAADTKVSGLEGLEWDVSGLVLAKRLSEGWKQVTSYHSRL